MTIVDKISALSWSHICYVLFSPEVYTNPDPGRILRTNKQNRYLVVRWSDSSHALYGLYAILQTCRTLAEVRREANRRDELSKSAMVVIPKVAAFSAPALP